MGALFGGGGGQAAPIQQQVGITNEEAQATSNAQSVVRARQRETLANRRRLSLANDEDDRLLS